MDFAERQKAVEQAEESIEKATSSTEETVAYAVFGLFVAVIVGTIIIFGLQKSKDAKIASLKGQIQSEVTNQLAALSDEQKEISTVLSQLDVLSSALSSRVKQSLMMTDLKAHQLKKSRWSQISAEGDAITISGSADDFDGVARSVAALRNMKAIQKVALTNASLNEDTKKVDFSLTVTVNTKQYNYSVSATPAASATASVSVE